jgi:hypothetical protein
MFPIETTSQDQILEIDYEERVLAEYQTWMHNIPIQVRVQICLVAWPPLLPGFGWLWDENIIQKYGHITRFETLEMMYFSGA